MTKAPPLRPADRGLPLPIAQLDVAGLRGIFTDIDDTLTVAGKLPAAVYAALERLRDAGFAIVPVTGRSAGWAHMTLHHWPVEAVVAESGGVCLHRDADGIPRWLYHDEQARIAEGRIFIASVAERVMSRVPGLVPADDNRFRLVDFALDHCETVPPVPPRFLTAASHGDGFRELASHLLRGRPAAKSHGSQRRAARSGKPGAGS